MNEKEFEKKLKERGFKNLSYNLPIYYTYNEEENKVFVDWDSIGEDIKHQEQDILEILNEQECEKE